MSGGKPVAVLVADTKLPRAWLAEEIALLEAVAHRTWLSVENARLFRAMQDEVEERKRAEAEQVRLYREVVSHRKRRDDLLATIPASSGKPGASPTMPISGFDFVSQHVEEMLGYSVQEWLSTPNFWLLLVHPDDREACGGGSGGELHTGTAYINEFRWVGKDQRVHWISAHSVVIKNEEGIPVGMRGVNLDVTER